MPLFKGNFGLNEKKLDIMPWLHQGNKNPGNDLLSHTISHAVSSALEGLTSVFGMGTGVSPPLWSPGNLTSVRCLMFLVLCFNLEHRTLNFEFDFMTAIYVFDLWSSLSTY